MIALGMLRPLLLTMKKLGSDDPHFKPPFDHRRVNLNWGSSLRGHTTASRLVPPPYHGHVLFHSAPPCPAPPQPHGLLSPPNSGEKGHVGDKPFVDTHESESVAAHRAQAMRVLAKVVADPNGRAAILVGGGGGSGSGGGGVVMGTGGQRLKGGRDDVREGEVVEAMRAILKLAVAER